MNKLFKLSIPVVLILGLMLTTACAAPGKMLTTPTEPTAPAMPAPVPRPPSASVDFVEEGGGYPSEVPGESTIERKIIKTGYITLEVEDVVEAMDEVAGVAGELDGYVVSSNKYEHERGISGSVAIRVPAESFEEAFERLRLLAINVPQENTQATDVTEEYVDLEARLRNLEATEAQYLALLEKATKVEEMLQVQQALSNVRGQIEQIEGRMKYLERTSDMSLIEVTLSQTKGLLAEPSWSASDAVKSAVRGLTTFGRGLATALIWIGIFCWVWIPPLVIWLRRRRRARG
ncbi:MAG: DUF4349 domain-containing protein [Dehalococcoidia bacterium]|nr:DUF4349 domain-containing protein [Dehalococcoidia bacterium]